MNLLRFILPLVVIGALALWIAAQRREIGALESETRTVRERVQARPPRPAASLPDFYSRPSDSGRVETDRPALQPPSDLSAWAGKDPAAAAAWLDLRISEGSFDATSLDGVSETRTEYEAALNGVLLSTDATAAAARLSALPEDQRRDVLAQIGFLSLDPDGRNAHVELLRGMIRENESAVSFDSIVAELVPAGGLAEVGDFLDEIQASPAERGLAAAQAASLRFEELAETRTIGRQDLDLLREWLERQSPGNAEIAAATVLAEVAVDGSKFTEISRLMLEGNEGSDKDQVLAVFLESEAGYSNLPAALEMASRIADSKLREKVIGNLRKNASSP